MANLSNLPSQVTSSYWDPQNFANWGIPRKSSKPQPVKQVEQPQQSPASSKPAPVMQIITSLPSAPSVRLPSVGSVKDSISKNHISPDFSTNVAPVATVPAIIAPAIAAPTITAPTITASTTTTRPTATHLAAAVHPATTVRPTTTARPNTTTGPATATATRLAAVVHPATTPRPATTARTNTATGPAPATRLATAVHPVTTARPTTTTGSAPATAIRPAFGAKDKSLPLHPKAAALRSWLDDDNSKPKPRRADPQRLTFENSGEKYEAGKPTQTTITAKKYTPPAIRPAKTIDVVRRMIFHDLGFKVPKKAPEQRAKDMAIREQERLRLSVQREERKKYEQERVDKKLNGLL